MITLDIYIYSNPSNLENPCSRDIHSPDNPWYVCICVYVYMYIYVHMYLSFVHPLAHRCIRHAMLSERHTNILRIQPMLGHKILNNFHTFFPRIRSPSGQNIKFFKTSIFFENIFEDFLGDLVIAGMGFIPLVK